MRWCAVGAARRTRVAQLGWGWVLGGSGTQINIQYTKKTEWRPEWICSVLGIKRTSPNTLPPAPSSLPHTSPKLSLYKRTHTHTMKYTKERNRMMSRFMKNINIMTNKMRALVFIKWYDQDDEATGRVLMNRYIFLAAFPASYTMTGSKPSDRGRREGLALPLQRLVPSLPAATFSPGRLTLLVLCGEMHNLCISVCPAWAPAPPSAPAASNVASLGPHHCLQQDNNDGRNIPEWQQIGGGKKSSSHFQECFDRADNFYDCLGKKNKRRLVESEEKHERKTIL